MAFVYSAWIPYPRPPPSVELRSGVLYSGCQCVKRDGLQHDCPRRGCQGRPSCMTFPAPVCAPSGNAPAPAPQPSPGWVPLEPPRSPGVYSAGNARGHPGNDKYLKMGRRGYIENSPVKHRRAPCQEHRKSRM